MDRRDFLILASGIPFVTAFSPSRNGFKTRNSRAGIEGLVVGVPYVDIDPQLYGFSDRVSDISGSGLVTAHGFKKNDGINVTYPTEGDNTLYYNQKNSSRARVVHKEFRRHLAVAAGGSTDFYFELRANKRIDPNVIEIETTGLSHDEASLVKLVYSSVASQLAPQSKTPELKVEPLDVLVSDAWGTKHFGTLLMPRKGFIVNIPAQVIGSSSEQYYAELVGNLVSKVFPLLKAGVDQNGKQLNAYSTELFEDGRFDYIGATNDSLKRTVITAPHGTADPNTHIYARDAINHVGSNGLIATGFLFQPSSFFGMRTRLNISDPLEGNPDIPASYESTPRAIKTFDKYAERVRQLAGGLPELYIEIHTGSSPPDTMELFTFNVGEDNARAIKAIHAALKRERPNLSLDGNSHYIAVHPLDPVKHVVNFDQSKYSWDPPFKVSGRGLNIELPTKLIPSRQIRPYSDFVSEFLVRVSQYFSNPGRQAR